MLNFLSGKRPAAKPKRPADKPKRPAVEPIPASPVDRIELRHIDGAVADQVRAFFTGKRPNFKKDGGRSVLIPHPLKEGVEIKIKGAGLYGRDIQFGTRRETGPKAPLFDFDGRMMEDVASGHDNAYVGGATFQQAATEYRMTQLLDSLGYPVVPCLGIGRVEKAGVSSWFSVFETRSDWATVSPPKFSVEEFCEANVAVGALLRDLAVKHDLIGYAWYVGRNGGPYYIKDLHPFRMADPVSMSQLSWVMQLSFALHILTLAAMHFAKTPTSGRVPDGIQALCFRAILPGATDADHERLLLELVNPYMLHPPQSFDQRDLVAVLRGNPITNAMLTASLDTAPPELACTSNVPRKRQPQHRGCSCIQLHTRTSRLGLSRFSNDRCHGRSERSAAMKTSLAIALAAAALTIGTATVAPISITAVAGGGGPDKWCGAVSAASLNERLAWVTTRAPPSQMSA